MKIVPITLAVLVLTLGGCAKTVEKAILDANGIQLNTEGSTATMKLDDGQGMMKLGDNVKVPDTFPKDVPVYAGSKVKTAFNMGNATQIVLMTPDAATKVVDFYKSQLKSAGWKTAADITSGDTVSLVLSKDKQRLQILIGPSADETSVSLTVATEE